MAPAKEPKEPAVSIRRSKRHAPTGSPFLDLEKAKKLEEERKQRLAPTAHKTPAETDVEKETAAPKGRRGAKSAKAGKAAAAGKTASATTKTADRRAKKTASRKKTSRKDKSPEPEPEPEPEQLQDSQQEIEQEVEAEPEQRHESEQETQEEAEPEPEPEQQHESEQELEAETEVEPEQEHESQHETADEDEVRYLENEETTAANNSAQAGYADEEMAFDDNTEQSQWQPQSQPQPQDHFEPVSPYGRIGARRHARGKRPASLYDQDNYSDPEPETYRVPTYTASGKLGYTSKSTTTPKTKRPDNVKTRPSRTKSPKSPKPPKEIRPDNLETRPFKALGSQNVKKQGAETPIIERKTAQSLYDAIQESFTLYDFKPEGEFEWFIRRKGETFWNKPIDIPGHVLILWSNLAAAFTCDKLHMGDCPPSYKILGPDCQPPPSGHSRKCSCTCAKDWVGPDHVRTCSCTCRAELYPHKSFEATSEEFDLLDGDSNHSGESHGPDEISASPSKTPETSAEEYEPASYESFPENSEHENFEPSLENTEPSPEKSQPETYEPEASKSAKLSPKNPESSPKITERSPEITELPAKNCDASPKNSEFASDKPGSPSKTPQPPSKKLRHRPQTPSARPAPPTFLLGHRPQTPLKPSNPVIPRGYRPLRPYQWSWDHSVKSVVSDTSSVDSDADKTGSKRRRKGAGTDPQKRQKCPLWTITVRHGLYYENGGVLLNPTEDEKARAIDMEKPHDKAANSESDQSSGDEEEEEDSTVDEEMADDETPTRPSVRPASRRGKSRLSTGSTDKSMSIISDIGEHNEAQSTEPARSSFFGSFGSGLGKLLRTPLSMFSPSRGPIPNFSEPHTQTQFTGSSSQNNKVVRQLFSDSKTSRKKGKSTKAQRQAASDYQVDLSKRKAAAKAIAASKNRVEDIEAEIERRVQEELDLVKQSGMTWAYEPSQQGSKRKRLSSGGDSPGSTPHPQKTTRPLLQEGSSNMEITSHTGSFAVPEDVSDEDVREPNPKRVKFANKTESLTTPDKGSHLQQQQQRRPPGTNLPSFDFNLPGHRSIIKPTNYDWTVSYDPNRDESSYQAAEEAFYAPKQPSYGSAWDHGVGSFNKDGDFKVPDSLDSSSDSEGSAEETDQAELAKTAGSTPMPKKTANKWAGPPPAPQPIHATLAGPSQSSLAGPSQSSLAGPSQPSPARSPPNQSSPTQSEAITAARAKANQYTPKQPSRLREATNIAPRESTNIAPPPPPPSTAITTERPQSAFVGVTSPIGTDLQDLLRRAQNGEQENLDPELSTLLENYTPQQIQGVKLLDSMHRDIEGVQITDQMRQEVESAFMQFWTPASAAMAVQQFDTGFAKFKQAQSTGLGF